MNTSVAIGIVAVILVLALLYKKYGMKKEGFQVSPPTIPAPAMISVDEVPNSQDYSPNIMALNGSQFRGVDFSGMVASPSINSPSSETVSDNYLTPNELLPSASMEQGSRYRDDGSIPNEGRVIAVNLAKNKHQIDCVAGTFNLGHSNIAPVNSVHAHYGDAVHFIPNSLITGSEYESAHEQVFQKDQRMLEMKYV